MKAINEHMSYLETSISFKGMECSKNQKNILSTLSIIILESRCEKIYIQKNLINWLQ